MRKSIRKWLKIAVMGVLFVAVILLDFCEYPIFEDPFYSRLFFKILQQICGIALGLTIAFYLKLRLFGKVEQWLYILPCLVVALNNFQWYSYFSGKMVLLRTNGWDFLLFYVSCLLVGFFEEIIFRGVLFSLLAGLFTKDRKGFLKAYVVSSLIFGGSHIFNGLSLASLLQVGYTILTGGLFAFCFIKTKNILCCAFVHGTYNFCGLLLDKNALGGGVIFDLGTGLVMAGVSVLIGIFVLYKVWKYTDREREELYRRLNVTNE